MPNYYDYAEYNPLLTATEIKNFCFRKNFSVSYLTTELINFAEIAHLKEKLGDKFYYTLKKAHHSGT
jgi:hypothetical protein